MFRVVGRRPVLAVLVAAVGISFSGILFRLSHDVSSSTGAFYRCVPSRLQLAGAGCILADLIVATVG